MLQTTKLTSKGQITLPYKVRKELNLKTGDTVGFDMEGGHISVRRISPIDSAYLSALEGTLSEWDSAEDEEAFSDLQ